MSKIGLTAFFAILLPACGAGFAFASGAERPDAVAREYPPGMLQLAEWPAIPTNRIGAVPTRSGPSHKEKGLSTVITLLGGVAPASIEQGWDALEGPTSAWVFVEETTKSAGKDGKEIGQKNRSWQEIPLERPIAFAAFVEADAGNSLTKRFLHNLSLGGLDRALYTFGGIGANGRPTADIVKLTYDGGKRKFHQQKVGELPMPLAFAGAVELKNKIYVVGGATSVQPLQFSKVTYVVDVAALADPERELKFEEQAGRELVAPAVVTQYTNYFYVSGGWAPAEDAALAPVDQMWAVLPKEKELLWQRRNPAPGMLGMTSAVSIGQSQIFVVGQGDVAPASSLADALTARPAAPPAAYTYNIALNRWVRFPDLRRPESVESPFVSPTLVLQGVRDVLAVGGVAASEDGGPAGVFTVKDTQKRFGPLDYTAIAIYVVVLIYIAYRYSRQEDTADFFVGGRRIPFWAVAVSAYATGTSAISFMALPALSYMENLVYLITPILQAVSITAVVWPVVGLLRRLEVTTMYEYLYQRFSRIVQWASSLAQLAFLIGGRMSVILFLPALALAQVTGVNVSFSIVLMGIVATFYTLFGGIKAVIWTDVLQTIVMVGGAVACLIAMIAATPGGLGGYVEVSAAHGKFEVFDFSPDLTLAVFWVFLIEGSFRGFVAISEQPTMQRVFATRTSADARKSVMLFAFLGVPGALLFYGLGTTLFAFYHAQPELVAPTLRNDAIFPLYIVQQLPTGVAGAIVAALFAASMSTLDSATNTSSALIVKDFYKPLKPSASEREQLWIGRISTVVVGVLATLIGLWMAAQDLPSLFKVFSKLAGILGGGMPGVILLGLLTRRANTFGVLTGLLASLILMLLLPFTFINAFLYVPVAIFTSLVVGFLASLPFPQKKDLTGLTVWTTVPEHGEDLPPPATKPEDKEE